MSAEVNFFSKTGTSSPEYLGCSYGAENAIRALAFTDEELEGTLSVNQCLALISCFPDEECIDLDLEQKLEALSANELVSVSIDY